jgi:hypothetical protein
MITKMMIKTPPDTPLPQHHGKWARATATWPLTSGLEYRNQVDQEATIMN